MSSGPRIYADYNATAPLRPEAKAAMVAALGLTGNPSSVHAEGRKALWERLQFALDGEPDPWFDFKDAQVDTRQFDALTVQEGVTA